MIKQQNYTKVAEYTKKAFQVICKRVLAAQLIEVLSNQKVKQDSSAQSQNNISNEEASDIFPSIINYNQQIYENKPTINFKNNKFNLKQIRKFTKVSNICYGDYVNFQWSSQQQTYRAYVLLDDIKLYKEKQVPMSNFIAKKMCFQICSPYKQFEMQKQVVNADSMICLKSLSTGSYVSLSSQIIPASQLAYKVALIRQINTSTIFRLVTTSQRTKDAYTDYPLRIVAYYNLKISLGVEKSSIDSITDTLLIGSYNFQTFKINKSQYFESSKSPYYYINCVGISKKITAEPISFSELLFPRQFKLLHLQCDEKFSIAWSGRYYQIKETQMNQKYKIINCESSLYQLWEIEKTKSLQKGVQCRISNIITKQNIAPQQQNNEQYKNKRSSILQLKEEQEKNHFIIIKDDNLNLFAVQNKDKNYELKFEQNGHKSTFLKNVCYKFQFIELEDDKYKVLIQLLECSQILKNNYPFLEKWGFSHNEDILKYSITDLKQKLVLIRRKINQIMIILTKLQALMIRQQQQLEISRMARQTKILQFLILYLKIINIKIHNKQHKQKEVYQLAMFQLKPLQDKLFQLIYILIYNNKDNSQIIISQSIFFNHLLSLYPQVIGQLLEQAIKNLCILTTKTKDKDDQKNKQQVGLIKWTSLIKSIKQFEELDIQRKYIDIISEVAIDPNDIGIIHYQNKIKEQLFGREKKKIFPKYITDSSLQLGPAICFQQPSYPIDIIVYYKPGSKCFELSALFNDGQPINEYIPHIEYINSLLKLMRNLCKDRNKKIPKVVEDYGLTQHYMFQIFKCGDIGWEMVVRFLDLYCAMYIVQDPFISFHKKQVKCYIWRKIQDIDFEKKTAILFRQYTEQHIAMEKFKQFDMNIMPLIDKYFSEIDRKNSQKNNILDFHIQKSGIFLVMVSVVLEIVNYGFLNYRSIRKYLKVILKQGDFWMKKQTNQQIKRKILQKIVQICKMTQQICTIIHGMHILKKVHQSFISSTQPTRSQIVQTLMSSLNDNTIKLVNDCLHKKKRMSTLQRSGSRGFEQNSVIQHPFQLEDLEQIDIITFTLSRVINEVHNLKTISIKKILSLLQFIKDRGERISNFLMSLLILRTKQEEIMYLEYSGIAPFGSSVEWNGSSRRLLNVMKVKQLVERITEDNIQHGCDDRKNQKIYELNNLLSKILANMEMLILKDYKVFKVCQIILQKLNMHSILMMILKYPIPQSYDNSESNYQSLVGIIIKFFFLFVKDNIENSIVMSEFFQDLTKMYAYKMLPKLLASLFRQVQNPLSAFDMIFSNIGKQMERDSHKQVLYETTYRIIKLCPEKLYQKIRGRVIYSLTSVKQFRQYIRGQKISINFINLFCFVGNGMTGVYQRVKDVIKKSELLKYLQDSHSSYPLKWVYLRLYHFLYVQSQNNFDQIQVELIVQKIFLNQLKHLTAQCRSAAQQTLKQFKTHIVKMSTEQQITRRKYTQSIKIDFGNLMMEGKQTLTASQEENYLNYMLNIQEQEQFSLLICLKSLISRFKICSIDGLAQYVFKLIRFMDRINIKQNTYQSRILSMMYEICQILYQKYGRTGGYVQKLPFKQAYSIVEDFYNKIAGLIQKERISYSQILKCAQVSSTEIIKARSDSGIKKMVTQSDLTVFVSRLSCLVNNREQNGSIAQNSIKDFFNEIRQKDTYQMNMLHFLSKLFEKLQHSKAQKLVKQINQNRHINYELDNVNEIQIEDVVNNQLIKKEIQSYKSTYEMVLKNFMSNMIQNSLKELLNRSRLKQKKIKQLMRLHLISQNYNVVNLIVKIMLNKFEIFQQDKSKSLQKYLTILSKQIQKNLDIHLIGVVKELYSICKLNTNFYSFDFFMMKLVSHIDKSIKQHSFYDNKLMSLFFNLLRILSQDSVLSSYAQKNMETFITEQLVQMFENIVIRYPQRKWLKYVSLLLEHIIESYQNYSNILQTLSSNSRFVANISMFISQSIKDKFISTNNIPCQKYFIINQLCKLLIKVRNKSYKAQIVILISEWNIDELFEIINQSYYEIIESKKIWIQRCQKEKGCTTQYCNEGKLTPHNQNLAHTLIYLLTVIVIFADLQREGFVKANSMIIDRYIEWKKGYKQVPKSNWTQLFRIVQKIQIKYSKTVNTVYFSLPFLNRFPNKLLEKQLVQQIEIFNKDYYFDNLYKLSYYVEQQYQSSNPINLLPNHYQSVLSYMQIIFIVYLVGACHLKILVNLQSNAIFIACNIIIFTVKGVIFVWNCRRFVVQRSVLFKLQYQDYTIYWKYIGIVSRILVLVSYGMLFISDAFYPLTLMLQINSIKQFQQIINSCIQGIKMMAYFWVHLEFLILGCAFIVAKCNENFSLLQVYIGLNYEITTLQSVALVVEDTSSFPFLREIPYMISVFSLLVLLSKTIFIASVVYQITKKKQTRHNIGEICIICGKSKTWFEKKGISFLYHKSMEHNIWCYIYFFIYIRRQEDDKVISPLIQKMITNKNYSIIKINSEDIGPDI